MQGVVCALHHTQLCPDRRGHRTHRVEGIRDRVLDSRLPGGRVNRVAEQQPGGEPRLRWNRGMQLGEQLRAGPRITARQRRGSGNRLDRSHDVSYLEQRQVAEPAREIAARDVDEPRQQRSTHERHLRVERVGELDGGHFADDIRSERVIRLGGDEGVGEHLGGPAGRQLLGDPAAQALLAGESAPRRGDREHRRDAVVADDARDLLRESRRVGEVGAPARRGDRPSAVRVVDRRADLGERGADLVVGEVDPDERV